MSLLKKMKLKRGILITKDLLKKEGDKDTEILYIPAWAFLLTV